MANQSFEENSFLGALEVAAVLLTAPLARLWHMKWGATREEIQRALPGDEVVPDPKMGYTRAITINAPASQIWPWLVQIGQGRGGLYSYDRLENLIGCEIHSADRILPEFQNLQVGDHILFGPAEKNFSGQVVTAIEPEQALVMQGLHPQKRTASDDATWVFVLDEREDGTTRLIVRQRLTYGGMGESILWHIVEPINFVMERRMLKGIKARAEAAA